MNKEKTDAVDTDLKQEFAEIDAQIRADPPMSGRKMLTYIAGASLLMFSFTTCLGIGFMIVKGEVKSETVMALFAAIIGPVTLIINWYFQKDRNGSNGK